MIRSLSGWAIFGLVLCGSSVALAAGWTESFPASASSSQIESVVKSVVVVGAGEPADEVQAAAAALGAGLRGSNRFKLVMGGEGLGPMPTQNDEEIVMRAAALPVDAILIVRVFPAGEGGPPMAVVTVFDREKKMLGAFTTSRGTPVEARAAAAAGSVLPTEVLKTITEVRTEKDRVDPAKAYEEQHVWLPEAEPESRFKLAYLGQGKGLLQNVNFYRVIKREDLVTSYFKRQSARSALIGTGVTALVAGGIVFGTSFAFSSTGRELYSRSSSDTAKTLQYTGIGVMGFGVALWVIGGVIDPHPVKYGGARQLAHDYNQELRKKLGLPALPDLPKPAAPEADDATESSEGSTTVSFMMLPGGLGIGIQGAL
jgi:hypothetical protein